jgi:hypothetical protein
MGEQDMQICWQSANLFPLDARVAIGYARSVPVIMTIWTDYCNLTFENDTVVTT